MLLTDLKKKYFFLDWTIYLLPISMIVGNAAININCLIISLLYLGNIFNQKINILSSIKIKYFWVVFFLFFFLNIYFSVHQVISLISFIGILKYIFLASAIFYCSKNIDFFIQKFSKIILITLILVCIDVLIQYFLGKDIFGYSINDAHGKRLSGPFGDEYIVGSYISKFALISLFFLKNQKNFYEYFYLLLVLGVVFLSNERSASFMCFISIIIYFTLTPNYKLKVKFLSFLGVLILIFSLFSVNVQLKKHFVDRTLQQFGLIPGNSDYEHNSFWDSRWGAHFLTAIEINKNNRVLGSGLHTFRIECKDQKYKKINSVRVSERCNTHPHNIYLEIWSELGILFFIFFIIFNIYFLFKLFKVYFFNKEYQQEASIIISLYSMLFFPIQTTGSLFSTWNGVIYWICIALCLDLFYKTKKQFI